MDADGRASPQGGRFTPIVFRLLPQVAEFTRSEKLVLPSTATAAEAWVSVFETLRTGGPEFIGGDVHSG